VELVAACALDKEHALRAAERWGNLQPYEDYRTMLDNEKLDFVVIATPPDTHAEIAITATQRGIHVLLEKPMARTVQECDAIIGAVQKHQTIFSLSHEKRYNPGFEKIKAIIDEGLLGQVFYLVVHWSAAVRLDPDQLCPPDYRASYQWRWTDPRSGGGIMSDHVPHYLDLWRWWTGSELDTVCAELLNVRKDLIGDAKLGGCHEDFGAVLMKFQNGAIGFFESGNAGRGLSPILQIGSGIGEWSEYGMLYGTRGHLIFDLLPWDSPELPRIMVYSLEQKQPSYRGWFQVELPDPWRSPGGPLSPKTNAHYAFKRQLDHFVECILKKQEPRVTGRDGRATLAAVKAVYESQRLNQKVKVAHG
jgi:predicted dehydrogenase